MTKIKLTYFDIDGGRGETARIALHAAGVPFEDERISFEEFGEKREGYTFRCVPVLEVDGVQITQSNTLNRFAGKKAGLYPEDEVQALYCDEVMDAVEDVTHHIGHTMFLQGDALKAAREELASGWLTTYLVGLGALLERGGGQYFADGRLTVADLRVFVAIRRLRKGILDHVPADLVDRLAPSLAAHQERVAAHPLVVAYYAR